MALQEIYQENTDGTYSVDFSPAAQEMAVAGAGNRVSILNLKKRQIREFTAVGFRKVPK